MGLCNGRVSVRLSVCLSRRPIAAAAWAGLLLSALQESRTSCRSISAAGRRPRSAANIEIFIYRKIFILFFLITFCGEIKLCKYGSNTKTQQRKHKYKQSENNDQVHHSS